jgi:predicted nucleotide-binding protein
MSKLPNKTKPARVFISYSHKDAAYLEKLETHLSLLRRQGIVESWNDRAIPAGDKWSQQIDKNIKSADIIILLISSDFLASDYCYDVEVKQALAMHNAGEAVVIPLILRPCDWGSAPFSRLQALPRDAKPVSTFIDQDEAFMQVVREIRRIAESIEPSEGLSPTIEFELTIDMPFEKFTEEQEKAIGRAIRSLLGVSDLTIRGKRRGSTILKLKLTRSEIERLRIAVDTGELNEFPVVNAEILTVEESAPDSTRRPRVFVGSSTEGLQVAEMIQLNLDVLCEVTVWHQGVFSPGSGTLQTLLEASRNYDFAVLVLTPDDLIDSRGETSTSPRDNVVFELGLFMGSLGSERTMIVYDRTADLKIPSDLAGVTMITYQPHSSGDLQATLGAPCTRLKQHITRYGIKDT